MKSMRKYLSGESTSPILECGESQFQAAFTMEPRSRTPLPPSPIFQPLQENVAQISLDIDHKLKLKPVPDFLVPNMTKISSESLSQIPKPIKPLRKFTSVKSDDPVYEPVNRSYDEIEYRKNAWQTMGIDCPNHTEPVNLIISQL